MWSVSAFLDVLRLHSSDVPLCCRLLSTLAHPTLAEPTSLLTPSRVCSAVFDAVSILQTNQDLLAAVFIEMDRRSEANGVRHMARLVCRSFFHSIALPHYESEFILFVGRLLELSLLPGVDPRQVLFGESSAFANLLSVYVDHSQSFRAFLDSSLRVSLLAGLSTCDASFELGQSTLLGTPSIEVSQNDLQQVCRQITSSLASGRHAIPNGFIWLLSRVSSLLQGRFSNLGVQQQLQMCAELAARCLALSIADPFTLNLVDEFLIASPHSITLLGQVANMIQRSIVEAALVLTVNGEMKNGNVHELTDFVTALFPHEAPSAPDPTVTSHETLPLAMIITGSELRLLIDCCRGLSAMHSEAAGRLATIVSVIPLTLLPQSVTAAPSKEASSSPLCALLASDVLLTFPPLVDSHQMVGLPRSRQHSSPETDQQTILNLRWHARRCRGRSGRTASTHSSGSNEDRRMRPMEKRTRFMLAGNSVASSVGAVAASNCDIEPSEAASTQFDPSEAASTHSCVSLDNDGSLSDVSGRATPDMSGRDTPLSAVPAELEPMSGSTTSASVVAPISVASSIQGSVISSSASFAVPSAPTPRTSHNRDPNRHGSHSVQNNGNRQHPTDDVTERFGKFDIKPEILASGGKAPSDSWSTEVMASELDWVGSDQVEEDSSRWSVEPEAEDAPSVSEIEQEQGIGGGSSVHGGAASSSFGGAAADDIDDEEMMMMVAAADANRFDQSGSVEWGEPPAVPESSAASWSMLFKPIASGYDDNLSDRQSDRASTSSANRESFINSSSLQMGATAATQAMSKIKNPFKQLGDKLKKGKRKATSSGPARNLMDDLMDDGTTGTGIVSGTATLRPSNSVSSSTVNNGSVAEAPADILRKYERPSSMITQQSSSSTPVGGGSALSSPVKLPQTDSSASKTELSSNQRFSSSSANGGQSGSTVCEQMLHSKIRTALAHCEDQSGGTLAALQRATAQGSVSERAVAREALRGFKQAVANGTSETLMNGIFTDTDAWPAYYTRLMNSLLHCVAMRNRTAWLLDSFRHQSDAMTRSLATRLAAILLMGDAERRLLDDTTNRFRAAQVDERVDIVLAMTERITSSINQWLTSWATTTNTSASAHHQPISSALADLRHVTLYQIERVFFSRNYTAGLLSAPSIRICQVTNNFLLKLAYFN